MSDVEQRPGTPRNRLAAATSPYLRQHADNPVDWYPWGAEALDLARHTGKPIHLSIGYAACHWCHVLARESFADRETAQLLNTLFVNVKVDREERPDLDKIYQIAQQMLTQGGGGWPLTMFLTPDDQWPFFGGTYFPNTARHGLPAFRTVIERVARYYQEQQPAVRAQNAALGRAFAELAAGPPLSSEARLDASPLLAARSTDSASFDAEFGGLRGAPKFPHPVRLERLLAQWRSSSNDPEPDLEALYLATLTLTRMAEGGLYDQLGGGFCRYAVDERWMIPHFEKMLYDNAALLANYADAALATGDSFYARIAAETADWMLRDLRAPGGAFFSSLDADSEGEEGRYYAWDRGEVESALTAAEWAVFAPRFGLEEPPNFERRWHLYFARPFPAGADAEFRGLMDSARAKLFVLRSQRVPPARDEKILTSWNALAIRGLARAARALERDDLENAAVAALTHLRHAHWREGRLLASFYDGRAQLAAYLDDHAFLADALLELLQMRWQDGALDWLRELLEILLLHFEDPAGGFFFTADDHEALIHRSKSFADEATPAGNGIAAQVLQRAGYVLGEPRYLAAAERLLRAAWPLLERRPDAHASLAAALEEYLEPPEIVILRGEALEIRRWARALGRRYDPHRLVLAIPAEAAGLPDALASKPAVGAAIAYRCRGLRCDEPVSSLEELLGT